MGCCLSEDSPQDAIAKRITNSHHNCLRSKCFPYKSLTAFWSPSHVSILQSIVMDKYNLSTDLFETLLSFIDQSPCINNDCINLLFEYDICSIWFGNYINNERYYNFYSPDVRLVPVAIIGAPGVGRNSLIHRFMNKGVTQNAHVHNHSAYRTNEWRFTVRHYHDESNRRERKNVVFKMYDINLSTSFWSIDNIGSLDWKIDSFIFVYSAKSVKSFEEIEIAYDKLMKKYEGGTVKPNCIIVCNKCDNIEDDNTDKLDKDKLGWKSVGLKFAQKNGIPFIQTSAKNDKNVRRMFELCFRHRWLVDTVAMNSTL